MPLHRKLPRRSAGVRVGLLMPVLVLAACSSNLVTAPPPTIPAAQPAVSPPAAQQPAGTVRPLHGQPSATFFDATTAQLVVLSPGGDLATPAIVTTLPPVPAAPRVFALPGPAAALTGDGRGTAYLSARGGYFVVDLTSGRTTKIDIDDAAGVDFTAIARRADGTMVLGSADGAVFTLASEPTEEAKAKTTARADIFARVDAIVALGNTAVVLDRGQTSVTTVGKDGDPQYALRAGEGATTLATDPRGLALVADTRGDQLLVYGVDPLMLRQAYPVRGAPYGLAGSAELVWVTQTATNTVIGYDLATGIPVEKVRYPTVRQPNALAFDDTSGTLYVVSGDGGGVQVIEHAARKR